MLTLYGIKNCDTMKKAMKWLDAESIAYEFHDYRKDGIDAKMLSAFSNALGWEALLNTRGTTWRKLDDAEKANMNESKAIDLMVANDALVKRPVWQQGGEYRLGFAAKDQTGIAEWLKN
ncbi:ArsC family reductase [Kordiimonas aquimaris]|uniref:ArsC family reductase n=1 Tax=Kordiimonas aquimaris TaxID=707591 RepID=UPI0021D0F807|nr:ArsC family reductase [Kordiimonas aquimaris]